MNTKCIISCAQGLGDWIIINPIIRMLSKTYKEVLVPYNYYSKDFIKNMFSDISNLSLHLNLENFEHHWLSNSEIINQYAIDNKYDFYNLMLPGKFSKSEFSVDVNKISMPFNRLIYDQIGLDWETDSKNFYIPINDEESKKFHDSLNLPSEYAFFHEGKYGNIDKNHMIDKSLKIFIPHMIQNVFLYKYTLEHATEIHVVDSGFYNFADKLNLNTQKIFLHKIRTKSYSTPLLTPILNKNWGFIDYF